MQIFSMCSVDSSLEAGTVKGYELHFGTVDAFFGQTLAHREDHLRLVLLLVANCDTVFVALRTGGAEGVQQF